MSAPTVTMLHVPQYIAPGTPARHTDAARKISLSTHAVEPDHICWAFTVGTAKVPVKPDEQEAWPCRAGK